MAELSTLARPYAKAIFEAAVADNKLSDWSRTLSLLASVLSNQSIRSYISDPSHSTENQADTLIQVCGDDLNDAGKNLVRLLAENKRLPALVQISVIYETLKAEQEKALDVEIISTFELSKAQEEMFRKALEARYQKTINITPAIDESLLGGAIIRIGDSVIDGSVKGKLEKLSEAIVL